jgi:hypothetical protein
MYALAKNTSVSLSIALRRVRRIARGGMCERHMALIRVHISMTDWPSLQPCGPSTPIRIKEGVRERRGAIPDEKRSVDAPALDERNQKIAAAADAHSSPNGFCD